MEKVKKKVTRVKKEEKSRKIATFLANMEVGEAVSPTHLFKSNGIHPDTGRDILDHYETLKDVGFKIVRDKQDVIKLIIKTNEDLSLNTTIAELKKDIVDIKKELGDLKIILSEIKKRR